MLRFLNVKNFALMEEMSIDFENGLTVITGETGAGKSMIVEAIATLCGERVDDTLIRTGKEFAEVTGIFCVPQAIRDELSNLSISLDDELIIKRRIQKGKKQVSFVNDQIVGLNLLKEIARRMIDLVGQYENQSLLDPQNHLYLIDRFLGLEGMRIEYKKNFIEYKELQKRFNELRADLDEKKRRQDLLKFEIEEITRANLKIGEEEELTTEKALLSTGERRARLTNEIVFLLYESEDSIYSNLSKVARLINELVNLDSSLNSLKLNIESTITTINELCLQLVNYREGINYSEERMEEVLSKLDLINRLKKKFNRNIKEILDYLEEIKKELLKIETGEEEIEKTKIAVEKMGETIQQKARELSHARKSKGRIMEKKVIQVLKRLGMERARFEIRFEEKTLTEDGMDRAEFYISTNPGEELKPLRKVGSGGEISRITLALKTILSDADKIPILIFDEVDTGIGGRIAEAVGELLFEVGKNHQIICITHLPQISVFAHNHILVRKEFKGKTTTTSVLKLNEDERRMEIARMLSGKEITKKVVEHAEEMLQKGKRR